jgi:O-antigen/teichoic acid export membrane protein
MSTQGGWMKTAKGVWQSESLRGRFARGAVWSLTGAVVAQGSTLVGSIIAARLLGRDQFGRYGMVQSTVGMLGIFAGLGLGLTATKFVAEYRLRDPERAGRIIALGSAVSLFSGGLLAVCLLLGAPLLATKTLSLPALATELRIASILLFLNSLNGAQTGALAGFEAFRTIARINLARGVVALPVTVGAVLLWHLDGAVAALTISSGVCCVLSHIALRRYCGAHGIHPRFASAWRERQILWRFSVPALLSGAMTGPAMWAASAMLVNRSGGYAEMGIFSAADQWRNAICFVPGVITQFALPLLSNLNGEGDLRRYAKTLRLNLSLTGIVAGLVAIPVALAAPYIMRLYGPSFQRGQTVLILLAVTGVVGCINGVIGTAILSAGSVWLDLCLTSMWAAVLLTSAHGFIPTHLAVGLAAAMLTATAAHAVWQTIYVRFFFPAMKASSVSVPGALREELR